MARLYVYQCRMLALAILALATAIYGVGRGSADDSPRWEKEIAPLLKRHCVKCHGPAKQEGKLNLSTAAGALKGGKDGAVITPHDLAASLLWKKVSEEQMPPESPLPEAERELIRRWIVAGAPGLKEVSAAVASGAEHWSFRPLVRPTVPANDKIGAMSSPIDRFIAAQLADHQLALNPPAERATVLRRLSFNLLGLPPRAEEVAAFIADDSPDAFERAADRYLASPHYGERWGKYWLDAAGYADSNGYFQADTDRPLAYRYRDYVIRSFNRDLPLDRFVREQLAGDELSAFKPGSEATAETIELLEATHYLRNGQDGSGESDGNPDEVRVDRYTALESAMQNTASSLLGLTIQCAKCHDHKFEPLTQHDYYRYQAIFYPVFNLEQWVKPADRFVLAPLAGEKEAWEKRKNHLAAEAARLESELAAWAREHRPRGETVLEDNFDGPADKLAERWSNSAPGDNAPAGDMPVNVGSSAAPGAEIVEGRLRIIESGAAGNRWLSTRQTFDWTPDGKGQAIQVTFDLVDNKLPGGMAAERIGYYTALHDYNDNSAAGGGNILIDGNPGGGTTVHLDYPGGDSKAIGELGPTVYSAGRNYGVRVTNLGEGKYRLEHVVDGVPEEKSLTLAAADLPDGGFGWEYCCGRSFIVDNVRIERFMAGPEQATGEMADFTAKLKERRDKLAAVQKERDELSKKEPGKIAWSSDLSEKPPEVYLLERGNYAARKEKVEAGPPEVLCDSTSPFAITPVSGAKTTGRRLAFANWLTAKDSRPAALLARVQVNRLWQNHFGTGLVATPENLGVSGAPPSHPELLEWLAAEFLASGWSFKTLHRRVVCSDTFRQSSAASAEALKEDPDGRLLSRFPLRRLDAEAIRDGQLAASGDLDERLYGPYVPTSRDGVGEVTVAESQPGARRRSIYLYQRRTQVVSVLAVFDAPSIVFNSVSRPRSTMPLQSLTLLNSEFAVARASHLAEELRANDPADESARILGAFVRTRGKAPSDSEAAAARGFVENQQKLYENEPNAAALAWQDLCQMLMASNEFLYVE